jgi:MFS family permease
MPEPPRGHAEGFAAPEGLPAPGRIREIFLGTPTLRYHVLGVSCVVFAVAGFSAWAPSFLQRTHGFPMREAAFISGAVFATAGLVGVLLGGYFADHFAERRADGRMRLILFGSLLSAPITVGTLYLPSGGPFLACFWLSTVIGTMWFSPATATVHDCVEPRHRGIAVAVYMALINILGFALGPLAVGAVSDLTGDLRVAMLLCPAAGLVGAAILHAGSRHVEADRARALARATA